jgi:hypothetical protein
LAAVLLSSTVLLNDPSAMGRAGTRDHALDGEIAVPDDRGVTLSTTCGMPSPGTDRLDPK